MVPNKKTVSRELEHQLRSVTFSPKKTTVDESATPAPVPKKKSTKPLSPNQRIVTVEYLDKLEAATIAHTRYESIQGFSHLLSNVSIALLSVSVITYLIFYLINPQILSLVTLLILALEAVALLGATLYTMSKTAHLKQLSEVAASDLSTCSHIIGNPRGGIYVSPSEPEEEEDEDEPTSIPAIDLD